MTLTLRVRGRFRTAAVVFMGLTAICWALVVVGFGFGSNQDREKNAYADQGHNERDEAQSYPLWIVCVSGPLVIASAYVHAVLRNAWEPIIGGVTVFLSVLYFTGLGMIMFINVGDIRDYLEFKDSSHLTQEDKDHFEPPWWYILELCGAFMTTLFWTAVMILWQFYERNSEVQ